MRRQKQYKRKSDVRYWRRSAVTYYLLWLITLAWTAWEAAAGREGFWWELAGWLVPAVILITAAAMGAALVWFYWGESWQL